MKHTPGPWRVDGEGGDDEIEIVGRPKWGCKRFGVQGEWGVATIEDLYEEHEDERFANARLIAAAPDMAEAMMPLLSMEVLDENSPDDAIVVMTWGTVKKMRAALSKAIGA